MRLTEIGVPRTNLVAMRVSSRGAELAVAAELVVQVELEALAELAVQVAREALAELAVQVVLAGLVVQVVELEQNPAEALALVPVAVELEPVLVVVELERALVE